MSLLDAAGEFERPPRIKAGAAVDAHKDGLPHAADAIDILAVPLVFATVGHKAKHLVLRLQHVREHACHVLVDLGVIDARGDTDQMVFVQVGVLVFTERLDVEGIDLGVRLDDGVHELFRIAVMARGVEDDGSHKKAFQL